MNSLLGIDTSKNFNNMKENFIQEKEPVFVANEVTKIRIYYTKKGNEKTDIFLFNNKCCKEQFIVTRTSYLDETTNEQKYKVLTDVVDDNFLTLIIKTQMFDKRQTYVVDSDIYRIGDISIEFCKMYKESDSNKIFFFFCINNPYQSDYEGGLLFIQDVMSFLFTNIEEKNIMQSSVVNEELLKRYSLKTSKSEEPVGTEKSKSEEIFVGNIISEKFPQIKLLQYIECIFY